MTATKMTPTPGRIVLYRGDDGKIRPAIVTVAWGDFSVNLHVFGQTAGDHEMGYKESVTHADPEQEPSCFPSWHWMPYQKQQAEKQAADEAVQRQPAPGAAHANYSTMQPHQQRVVDEQAELDDRAAKLNTFINTTRFADLDEAERHRMRTQYVAMKTYSDILGERIAAFK